MATDEAHAERTTEELRGLSDMGWNGPDIFQSVTTVRTAWNFYVIYYTGANINCTFSTNHFTTFKSSPSMYIQSPCRDSLHRLLPRQEQQEREQQQY